MNRLREATDWAQAAIASAQALQEEQSNKRRQAAPVYKKGDWVWLNLRNIRTQRQSKKLDWLHAQYRVLDVPTPHTVRLEVPTGVHPVFHVELVRPAASDPFPSQIVDDSHPPPMLVNGELEYEVEEIIDVRRKKIGRGYRDEALVKWTGWAEQTWQRLDDVRDCSALDAFERRFGPVSILLRARRRPNTTTTRIRRTTLKGGYCHGPVPGIRSRVPRDHNNLTRRIPT